MPEKLSLNSLILYCIFIVLASLTGGMVPLWIGKLKLKLDLALSFSAGVMLGVAFLHMIPYAIELVQSRVGFFILLGFLFLYIFEKYLMIHVCEAESCEVHEMGTAAIVGLSVHYLTDGIALGIGGISPTLGLAIFLAILIHKAPSGFSLTSILLNDDYKRCNILLINLFLSCMIPLGAFATFWNLGDSLKSLLGLALAFSAGTFIYISVSDLLPEVHRQSKNRFAVLATFLLGLLFTGSVGLIEGSL